MSMMIPGTKEYMMDCNFWVKKIQNADRIIMSREEIGEFNKRAKSKSSEIHNIKEYPEKLTKEELIKIIKRYSFSDKTRYDKNGEIVTEEFLNEILKNTNIDAVQDSNEIQFGITVNNARIRSFPTDDGCFAEKGEVEFDRFQESECQAIEPVAILHTSLDREWLFIQMYNYNGWVRSSDIAIAKNKKQIFDYLEVDKFLVVTGNRVSTQFNHYDSRVSRKDYYMGAIIPLEIDHVSRVGNQRAVFNHVVKLPVREENGELAFKNALMAMTEDVNLGFLDYTRENILRQAFKLQGDRYDWGNKNNGRDCSSFVMCVYKTFGIVLPRNADEQELYEGIKTIFEDNLEISKRASIINNYAPGAALFMKGHVMLFIGEIDGEAFMIHDFHKYGFQDGESLLEIEANEIAVTSTLLLTSKGKSFIEAFTSIIQYEI